jgi:peptide/nickel transport system permease protein
MQKYIIRRLLHTLYIVVALSVIIFTVVRLVPGDPAQMRLGKEATPEAIEQERQALGLDKPMFVQYFIWAGNVLRGDFGVSWISHQPARHLVWEKFKVTVPLTLAAMLVGLVIGIPLGIIAGLKPHTWLDSFAIGFSLFGVAVPSFWTGMMLILFFAVQLRWLPASGYGPPGEGLSLRHLILPSIALGIQLSAMQARFMRSGMLDVMSADFIRTARAKGLPERLVVLGHALKNALLSVVTVFALDFAALLGGALVTEQVFRWPGMGLLLVGAINNRDYGVVQAAVLFIALIYVVANLLADLSYGFLDPRIRYE